MTINDIFFLYDLYTVVKNFGSPPLNCLISKHSKGNLFRYLWRLLKLAEVTQGSLSSIIIGAGVIGVNHVKSVHFALFLKNQDF